MTDQEIAKRLRKRDMDAFAYIMDHYNKLLWLVIGNVLEKVGTAEDIEDCISEVYLKLLEKPQAYDPEKGSLKSFLVSMGKNQALDRYRKLAKSGNATALPEEGVMPESELEADGLAAILAQEKTSRILTALNFLKEPDKEILIRRYFFGEKPKLIAEKMRLATKDIENRLYQGKLKLKKILEG